MQAEGTDAVAGAEERDVPVQHHIQHPPQLGLDGDLQVGLQLLRVGGIERAAADHHPGMADQEGLPIEVRGAARRRPGGRDETVQP
ncbi:hypothetical protein ACFFX0_29875 [Citricoccus parietis]|uniref:Uncharacterized protein n=1 Tax=Citricoccus parietis TaxID=592307 RepID=A0ABV5G895_9MICC